MDRAGGGACGVEGRADRARPSAQPAPYLATGPTPQRCPVCGHRGTGAGSGAGCQAVAAADRSAASAARIDGRRSASARQTA